MDELMLKVENVSKIYRLGEIGSTTLRDELQRISARVRGKDDPTKRIGTKYYDKGETFTALNSVSFNVTKGERVGIIGQNGAGKSTLLKLISRVTAPSSGMIGLNGRIASMLEVGTGFHNELTGRENVYMNGAILGMTKKEIDAKMEEIIDFSECRQFIDTPVKRYSSGMYVKLAFSVAAHLNSEIMIMDEVLAVGDMKFQQKCLGKMGSVSESEGRTILYVSHNMQTIRQLCNRCIVLDHGKLIFDGSVEEAIGVYEERGIDKKFKTDLRFLQRRWVPTDYFRFIEITPHKNVTYNRIATGDKLLFDLIYFSRKVIQDVNIRFEIRALDGTVAGLMFSNSCINYREIDHQQISVIEVDTMHIAPGWYRFDLIAYLMNDFGVCEMIDRVEGALQFEIVKRNGNDIEWNSVWGHTRFEDIKIQKTYGKE